MDQISLMNLFNIGTHRGNSKSKLNPRLKSRVHAVNNGVCIIDLVKTIDYTYKVADFLESVGRKRQQILVVGTSKHIRSLIPDFAEKFLPNSMPYVDNRWLGGTLTNWSTIKRTLKTLEKLENIEANEEFFNNLAKNERLRLKKEKNRILKFFKGLKSLKNNKPAALLVVDVDSNAIAIKEAELMGIPVIGLTNTKVSILPQDLSNTIVCNIYSSNTVNFVLSTLVEAYNKGFNTDPKPVEDNQESKNITSKVSAV